jgi:MOSC domain-containing protein YiiM
MRVLSLNLGRPASTPGTEIDRSLADKQPTDVEVSVDIHGIAGIPSAPLASTPPSHAIYAYPVEHFAFWQTVRAQARVSAWDLPVPAGLLGEDLTLQGLTEDRLWVGDRLRLPHCVLAVSEPRLPDAAFAAAAGFPQALTLLAQSGYCGAWLGVIEPGSLRAGDRIELLPGPRAVNLRELFRQRLARPT